MQMLGMIYNVVNIKKCTRDVSASGYVTNTQRRRIDMNILAYKISGIYEIVNTVNGHRYIGSAVNIDKRWREHLLQLKKHTHHSVYLQRAWDKHGSSCFTFSVIEHCVKEQLIDREQFYINAFSPEYNICKIANSRLGTKWTDESKKKLSSSKMGKSPSQETRKKIGEGHLGIKSFWAGKTLSDDRKQKTSKSLIRYWIDGISTSRKAVNQFSKQGILINSFSGMGQASIETGIQRAHISRCCLGKRPTAGGFIWRYAEVDNV